MSQYVQRFEEETSVSNQIIIYNRKAQKIPSQIPFLNYLLCSMYICIMAASQILKIKKFAV